MTDEPILPKDSRLVKGLVQGDFVITSEITPPPSANPDDVVAAARDLSGQVHAVNVTDGPRARVHVSSLAAASILLRHGIEPILQMTCRDRNRIALQADLLGAAALGLRAILVMRGDPPNDDGTERPKPVFDLESLDLLRLAAEMRDSGRLSSGRELMTAPSLFLGSTDTPIDPPAGWTPARLQQKIEAGAQFIQTQFCFDFSVLTRYTTALSDAGIMDRAHLLVGLGPLASSRSAAWMRTNLPGVIVPDAVVARLEKASDQKVEGIKICAELMQELQGLSGVAGVHLMATTGDHDSVRRAILESAIKRPH